VTGISLKRKERGMKNMEATAVDAAREAGILLKSRFRQSHQVTYKGEIDLVTEADALSEELIVKRITSAWPDHDILAEERPGRATGAAFRWIIDPLDGTTNYAHGYPVFCVSIALEREGRVVLGVIYNPMLEELFVAREGGGAFRNGERIAVSKTGSLNRSLLATGFPYDIRENPVNNISYFNALAVRVQAIRRAGSAALDLAYVATGRFDGFWELRLRPWDTAAGALLVREAGGMVTEIGDRPFHLLSPSVVATNGRIHRTLNAVLGETDPLDERLAGSAEKPS